MIYCLMNNKIKALNIKDRRVILDNVLGIPYMSAIYVENKKYLTIPYDYDLKKNYRDYIYIGYIDGKRALFSFEKEKLERLRGIE